MATLQFAIPAADEHEQGQNRLDTFGTDMAGYYVTPHPTVNNNIIIMFYLQKHEGGEQKAVGYGLTRPDTACSTN